jgi:nucleoside-diphosphate-sugar epimerase
MPYSDFDLTGRIVIVTGAGRGLGRGMAFALAEAGAAVVVADRSKVGVDETADLIGKRGNAVHPIVFDAVRRRLSALRAAQVRSLRRRLFQDQPGALWLLGGPRPRHLQQWPHHPSRYCRSERAERAQDAPDAPRPGEGVRGRVPP